MATPPPATDLLDTLGIRDERDRDTALASRKPKPQGLDLNLARPDTSPSCSTTDSSPSPSLLLHNYFNSAAPPRPSSGYRTRSSPYLRSHLRSRSTGSGAAPPSMTRTKSMPNAPTLGNPLHLPTSTGGGSTEKVPPYSGPARPPGSPARSPRRVNSPFRQDESPVYARPRSPGFASGAYPAGVGIESIQEDSELDITPRGPGHARPHASSLPQPPSGAAMASFSRSGSLRRRPASPLHALANAQSPSQTPGAAPTSAPVHDYMTNNNYPMTSGQSSRSSSPNLRPQPSAEKFNESYPSLHHYASSSSFSSMPSTPTSTRSRSPSISSLDTIEDTPDLESEAIEHERLERLKLAAERQERMARGEDVDEVEEGPRRRSLDVPGRSGGGFGFSRIGGRGGQEKKRWSICGGERRADLDLETIWED
ncbi:hypothetical protein B0A50_08221 [Salinomyces thailandicus]|uniref:Basic proline-rich protein n=1 Tax=Salinomyces thailandicus TaxID=706561 RepID=A0A4V5N5K2_9PEZI|nr:hypothetical protein B0A50_08221 [Salinomyces thailandica]